MFLALLLAFSEATDSREPPPGIPELCRRVWLNPPRLKETWRFPPKSYVIEQMIFNRWHNRWLEAQQISNIDQNWQPWINENDRLYAVWDALDDSLNDWCSVWNRRMALKKVKDALGADWWVGKMPPGVPIWWFRES